MSIEFHCPKCGAQVKAPNDAGGRRGKCPSCEQSVYIPTPEDQLEPLELEPLNEEEERRQQELLEESRRLAEETRRTAAKTRGGETNAQRGAPDVDVQQLVTDYAQRMSAGELEDAESIAKVLARHPEQTREVAEQILMDEVPPEELSDIPRPVLAGFLKQLTQRR